MENKKEERFKVSIAQKALLYDEKTKKYLLLKAKNPSKYFVEHYGPWEIPGGKLEDNEGLKQGLSREIDEELGDIEYEIVCPINTRKIILDWGALVLIDYLVKYKKGEVKLSDEHGDCRWQTAEEIEKNEEYRPWIKKLIETAQKIIKSEEYLDGWKRAQADFENYKKRQAEMMKDAYRYANQGLIQEILPVLDNFHASTGHIPASQKDDPWVVGIMHIRKQLEKVLEDNNVSEIKIKKGDKFDPEIMEAIKQESKNNEQGTEEECKNAVKQVVARGYKIGERVIRPARVVVE